MSPNSRIVRVALADIVADERLQIRVNGIIPDRVEEFREVVRDGREFRELMVAYKQRDGRLLLTQGFHRHRAYLAEGVEFVEIEVRDGTFEESLLDACSYVDPGEKRTNEDKRHSVHKVLELKPQWTNHQIAKHCGVSHTFVNKIRPNKPREPEPSRPDGRQRQTQGGSGKGNKGAASPNKPPRPVCEQEETGQPQSGGADGSAAGPIETFQPGEEGAIAQTVSDQLPADIAAVEDMLDLTAEQLAALGFKEPKKVVEFVSPKECRHVAGLVGRHLRIVQEMVSGLMAGPFAEEVQAAMSHDVAKRWHDTGEMIVQGEWGRMKYGIRRYTCDPLDDLLSFVGAVKSLLDRAKEKEVVITEETVAPWELGTELGERPIEI